MHRFRNMVMAGAVSALAISALGAPVAAASHKGTVAIVNGIPGGKVDICINGKEVRSGLKYGGKTFKTMNVGPKQLKVRKATPGKCKGKKLAGKTFELASDVDVTVVATKKSPKKVLVFDNVNVGQIPPTGADPGMAWLMTRHAADLGEVVVTQSIWNALLTDEPITPAVAPAPTFQKGDTYMNISTPNWLWRFRFIRPGTGRTIAKTARVSPDVNRRYEWYLVGTKAKNAKLVAFSRPASLPTP